MSAPVSPSHRVIRSNPAARNSEECARYPVTFTSAPDGASCSQRGSSQRGRSREGIGMSRSCDPLELYAQMVQEEEMKEKERQQRRMKAMEQYQKLSQSAVTIQRAFRRWRARRILQERIAARRAASAQAAAAAQAAVKKPSLAKKAKALLKEMAFWKAKKPIPAEVPPAALEPDRKSFPCRLSHMTPALVQPAGGSASAGVSGAVPTTTRTQVTAKGHTTIVIRSSSATPLTVPMTVPMRIINHTSAPVPLPGAGAALPSCSSSSAGQSMSGVVYYTSDGAVHTTSVPSSTMTVAPGPLVATAGKDSMTSSSALCDSGSGLCSGPQLSGSSALPGTARSGQNVQGGSGSSSVSPATNVVMKEALVSKACEPSTQGRQAWAGL